MSLLRSSTLRAPPRLASIVPRTAAPRTAFHTSQKLRILPAGPQVIQGSINDAAPVPETNPKSGSYHWTFERLLSLGLIPLTIAPFAGGAVHPVADAALAAAILLHSHIGFQSCIVDYIPLRKYPKSHKGARYALNAGTLLALYGFYEFETNDVGLTEAVKRIWKA